MGSFSCLIKMRYMHVILKVCGSCDVILHVLWYLAWMLAIKCDQRQLIASVTILLVAYCFSSKIDSDAFLLGKM